MGDQARRLIETSLKVLLEVNKKLRTTIHKYSKTGLKAKLIAVLSKSNTQAELIDLSTTLEKREVDGSFKKASHPIPLLRAKSRSLTG